MAKTYQTTVTVSRTFFLCPGIFQSGPPRGPSAGRSPREAWLAQASLRASRIACVIATVSTLTRVTRISRSATFSL
jgi:hypothetical protein